MLLLIVFAFIAGIVTVLSPCILPLLPIILSSSVESSGKMRPLGVVTGFVASFTFFTLFLSTIVSLTGISASALRLVSVFILLGFGISLLIPRFQMVLEGFFSRLSGMAPKTRRSGFGGGIIVGLSLGLLWTPCVGPILASVISLAITGTVTLQTFVITLAYSLGTAIPMFLIILGGSTALTRVPWLVKNTGRIQKAFGVIMILTSIAIIFNVDRSFQTFILDKFPKYGSGLTEIENNQAVQDALGQTGAEVDQNMIGKPMNLLNDKGELAHEIIPGGKWFNLPDGKESMKLADLKGKVVIVDFWTYSCINCQRTLPYLKSWYDKYHKDGLEIIGVHAPEFEFEKDAGNLAKAIADFDIKYPVVQDNDFATWRAYDNHFWPAKYIVDKDGYIRYTHFGEGKYDEIEEVIQELLKESGSDVGSVQVNNPEYDIYAKTPETYIGYNRASTFASLEPIAPDKVIKYIKPANLPNDLFALEGDWEVNGENASPKSGAKLYLNFESKEVYLVARPKKEGVSAQFKVYLDGKAQELGADAPNGVVKVDSDKLYKLINLDSPGRHELRLEFLDDNVEIFAFTFG